MSVVDEILSMNPRIDHPRDQKQGCAPLSLPCSNQEAPSAMLEWGDMSKQVEPLFLAHLDCMDEEDLQQREV